MKILMAPRFSKFAYFEFFIPLNMSIFLPRLKAFTFYFEYYSNFAYNLLETIIVGKENIFPTEAQKIGN